MSDVGGIGGTPGANGLNSLTGPQTAATALAALRRHAVSTIEISDTTQNIAKNLDALQAYAGKITSITTTSSNQKMSVTGTQYQKDAAILAKWGAGTGQTVGITSAKASIAGSLASYVASVQVADSSANIQRYIDNLQTIASSGVLSEIVQTGNPGNITITSAQLTADQDALDKIKNHGYTLAITNASVSDVLGLDSQPALSDNAKVRTISIVDTTEAIADNLDALQQVGLRLKSISQSDAANPLELTGDQYKNDKAVLGKIITSDLLAVIDASTAQVKLLAADHKVVTVEIQDTSSNLARNWALLDKLGDSLTAVQVSDQATAIRLTADQFAASTALLGKFTDIVGQTYKLNVTNVSGESALAVANGHNVDSVDVSDSAANLVSNLADLKTVNGLGKLGSVSLSGLRSPLSMDVSMLQGADLIATQAVLDKFKGQNYTLAVTGVATADLGDVTGNSRVVSIAVGDSSDNIESSIATLHQLGSRLSKIDQTDVGAAFDLTQTTMNTHGAVLSKVSGGYVVNLTGVTAAKAAADALNAHVAGIAVSDTGRNILAHWAELRAIGANLTSVAQSDVSALSISADNYQLGAHDGLVAKLGGSSFSVTGATVAQAQAIGGDAAVTQIDVTAEGSVITDNLTALAALVTDGKLASITNQTPTVSLALNASQLTDAQDVLDLIKGGSYTMAVSGVAVGDAKDLIADNNKIASVAVTGDAADIVTNLSDLKTLGRKLALITQTDAPGSTLNMTGADFAANSAALAKIEGGFLAVLSDVSATKAASFATNASIKSMTVSDTGDNLDGVWRSLGELGGKLTEVTQTDSSTLELSASDWLQGQTLAGKFTTDLVVSALGADVSQVAALAADDLVESIKVSDSASSLSAAVADLAAEAKITEVAVQDPTVALTISAQDYADAATLFGMVKNDDYLVALSDVAAADVGTLASDAHVDSMDVSDTSDNVSTNFDALAAATNLNSIALSDDGGTVTLTADQILGDGASTMEKISGAYQLAATDVAMIDIAAIQDVPQTSSISISDTSDNVSANFSDILALGETLTAIHLTDGSPVLALSQQDWEAGTDALATIDGSYQVDVSDTAAGDAATVASDGNVRNVLVADTASNVSSQWDALVALYDDGNGQLTGISLTDANALVLTADQQTAGAAMITALLPDETIETAP